VVVIFSGLNGHPAKAREARRYERYLLLGGSFVSRPTKFLIDIVMRFHRLLSSLHGGKRTVSTQWGSLSVGVCQVLIFGFFEQFACSYASAKREYFLWEITLFVGNKGVLQNLTPLMFLTSSFFGSPLLTFAYP